MKFVHTYADIGPDRMLHLPVSEEIPEGQVEVLIVLEPRPSRSPEERRAAAEAGAGALKHLGLSTEEFLAERREDDRRRDKALGL